MPVQGKRINSAFLEGDQLGDYYLEKSLSHTVSNVVYRAHKVQKQHKKQKKFAIKIVSTPVQTDLEKIISRYETEFCMMRHLSEHESVLNVHELGYVPGSGDENSQGYPYIVMELLENGKTLQDLLDENTLSLSNKIRIITKLAEAINDMHRDRVVHRDIKPNNIYVYLNDNGDVTGVQLFDFGLAAFADQVKVGFFDPDINPIVGSIYYVPPEEYYLPPEKQSSKSRHIVLSPTRRDIYSLMEITYQVFTGTDRIFGDDNAEIYLSKTDTSSFDSMPGAGVLYPSSLGKILKAMYMNDISDVSTYTQNLWEAFENWYNS